MAKRYDEEAARKRSDAAAKGWAKRKLKQKASRSGMVYSDDQMGKTTPQRSQGAYSQKASQYSIPQKGVTGDAGNSVPKNKAVMSTVNFTTGKGTDPTYTGQNFTFREGEPRNKYQVPSTKTARGRGNAVPNSKAVAPTVNFRMGGGTGPEYTGQNFVFRESNNYDPPTARTKGEVSTANNTIDAEFTRKAPKTSSSPKGMAKVGENVIDKAKSIAKGAWNSKGMRLGRNIGGGAILQGALTRDTQEAAMEGANALMLKGNPNATPVRTIQGDTAAHQEAARQHNANVVSQEAFGENATGDFNELGLTQSMIDRGQERIKAATKNEDGSYTIPRTVYAQQNNEEEENTTQQAQSNSQQPKATNPTTGSTGGRSIAHGGNRAKSKSGTVWSDATAKDYNAMKDSADFKRSYQDYANRTDLSEAQKNQRAAADVIAYRNKSKQKASRSGTVYTPTKNSSSNPSSTSRKIEHTVLPNGEHASRYEGSNIWQADRFIGGRTPYENEQIDKYSGGAIRNR